MERDTGAPISDATSLLCFSTSFSRIGLICSPASVLNSEAETISGQPHFVMSFAVAAEKLDVMLIQVDGTYNKSD